ncbi:SNF2-related protein [Streptomyces sp. NPDC048629]|uniref:SNF2-related protein n=1 Tax=Streptomyces sp. NPDC048629 TaxID=3154824 RepID=UPI003422EBE7
MPDNADTLIDLLRPGSTPPTPDELFAGLLDGDTYNAPSDPLDAVLPDAAREQDPLPVELRQRLDEVAGEAFERHLEALDDNADPSRVLGLYRAVLQARDSGRLDQAHTALNELTTLSQPTGAQTQNTPADSPATQPANSPGVQGPEVQGPEVQGPEVQGREVQGLEELSAVVDTAALLRFEAGSYQEVDAAARLEARRIVAQTMHFRLTIAEHGEGLAERSPLEYWTTLAVLHTLTSGPGQTITPDTEREAHTLAQDIRTGLGLPRPTRLPGGTPLTDSDEPTETNAGSGSGSGRQPTVEGLSELARKAYEATLPELGDAMRALPDEYTAGLRNRAEDLLREHFPPTAHLPFDDGDLRVEFIRALGAVQYALFLGQNTPSPQAAAVELAQLYAYRHPRGYPSVDGTTMPSMTETTPAPSRTARRTPRRQRNTIGSGPGSSRVLGSGTRQQSRNDRPLEDEPMPDAATPDQDQNVMRVTFSHHSQDGEIDHDLMDVDQDYEDDQEGEGAPVGNRVNPLDAEFARALEEFDAQNLGEGLTEDDLDLDLDLYLDLDDEGDEEGEEGDREGDNEGEGASVGDGDNLMDAEFERALEELDAGILGEGLSDDDDLGLGLELDEDLDYLAFAEATRPVRGAGAEEDGQEDAGEGEGDDASEASSSSLWSDASDASYTDEVRGAELKALVEAADREAAQWDDLQPPPTQVTREKVRRLRRWLQTEWGPEAFDYPVVVQHYSKIVNAEARSAGDVWQTLRVLSLTPHGLAVPVETLGRWLTPGKPLSQQQILGWLERESTVSQDVPSRLGSRQLAPGETEGGQRAESVVAVLDRLGIGVWQGGRLTPAAVTVLAGWAVELGARQALRRPMADVEAIAEALFGHRGERAVAFVEFHLSLAQIPHPYRPLLWGRPMEEVEDEEPVTGADRVLAAVAVARRHWKGHGGVDARQVAKLVAGHGEPSLQELHKGLDVLEFSGFTGRVHGSDLWDVTTTGEVTDASLEAQTMDVDDHPVRDEQGELTPQGRQLLKTEVLRIGGRQAARLGGADLDALVPQVFATAHRHTGRRTARRWLHEARLRILTPDELPIAHLLDALRTDQEQAAQEAGTDIGTVYLDFDAKALGDLYFSHLETDPDMRELRVRAVLQATSLGGPAHPDTSNQDMITTAALLEKDTVDSRDYARRTGRHRYGVHTTLLRRMARESRRDMLDHLTAQLPHVPKPVMTRLADTWHHTLSYLTRHTTPTSTTSSGTTPSISGSGSQDGAVVHDTSSSIPATTFNALADFTTRAKEAVAAQNTHRPDYTSITADLFHPDPTPLQIEAVRHLAPVPYGVTREGAVATAQTIVALMQDATPVLPESSTRAEKIDYIIWKAAHDLSEGRTPYVARLENAVKEKTERSDIGHARGYLFAFALGGAVPTRFTAFTQLPPAKSEMRELYREYKLPDFHELDGKLRRRVAREQQRTGVPEGQQARQEQQAIPGDFDALGAEMEEGGELDARDWFHLEGHLIGMYRAWGLDEGVLPQDGIRYRLAVAARKVEQKWRAEQKANTTRASDIAAELFGVDRPGIDHIMLVEELLRQDLNLEDQEFPGPARIILDLMADQVPPPVPGPRSSRSEKQAWDAADSETKSQWRIEVALYGAAKDVIQTGKINLVRMVVDAFADMVPTTRANFRHWAPPKAVEVRGWLEVFGFGHYIPPRSGERELLGYMEQAFDEAWETLDLGDQIEIRTVAAGLGFPASHHRLSLKGWFEATGLLGGGIPPGSVRERMLGRVQMLMDQGVVDEMEMAKQALGVRRPHPSQVIAVKQMMRIRSGRAGVPYLPAVARQLLSHHQGTVLPPGARSTLQDRIDYAIWRAASSIAQKRKLPLAELTRRVFNQAPSATTPLGSHATSPIGQFARRYFLLGVLTVAGLRPSYRQGASVAKYLAAIVGEYQVQKADDGSGASQHSTARELFAHHYLPHAYQAFIWGVLETLGLRGTALPATGLRSNMERTAARMLAQTQQGRQVTPAQVAAELFGTGDLNAEGMAVTGLWMKLAAPHTPPSTAAGGTVPPGLRASLVKKAEYVVAATLHARAQPAYIDDDIDALVEDLFGTSTDTFGRALVIGVLEGAALIRLNNGLDPDHAQTAFGAALTPEQAQYVEHDAHEQQKASKRIVVSLAVDAVFTHNQQHYHARVRGLLAGRGILPPPNSRSPLDRLHQDILAQGRRIQQTHGALTVQDIDDIAYQALRLTMDPDDHQRRIITAILTTDGITVTDHHTHPDDDMRDDPDHHDDRPDSHDGDDNDDNDDNDDSDDNDGGENGDSLPRSDQSGIGTVLAGGSTSRRTVTAADLRDVPLPELDDLRTGTPTPPEGSPYDAAQAADYATELALQSSPEHPVDAAEVADTIAPGGKASLRNVLTRGVIFAAGGYFTGEAKMAKANYMNETFRLIREKQQDGRPHTINSIARNLSTNRTTAAKAVEGFLMAVGLGNFPISAGGARDKVRKSVYALADVFKNAGTVPHPGLMAQRIYTNSQDSDDRHITIVEEFLRQRGTHDEAESEMETWIGEASMDVDLSAVSLDEVEELRSAPIQDSLQGDEYDSGLAADYAMGLALSSSTSIPVNAADHVDALTPKKGGPEIRANMARALLYACGVSSLVLPANTSTITTEKMSAAFSLASEEKKPNVLYTPHDIKYLGDGRKMQPEYVRGYWAAAGLRDYTVRGGGAWSVVKKHVNLLAEAFKHAGKEPDARVIARLIYTPQGYPKENQVTMVTEFLRQRAAATESDAWDEIDLESVPLDHLEELRTETPEPLVWGTYDPLEAADYAVQVALAESSPVKLLTPTDYGASVSSFINEQDTRELARALFYAAGAFMKPARNNKMATLEHMDVAFAYARTKQHDGLPHTPTSAAKALKNLGWRGKKEAFSHTVRGFWMAVGLGGFEIREGGSRDVVRKAVFTLAGVFEDAGRKPDAVRIAQRIYARGQKPVESQVAVVKEFLRQREESVERALAPVRALAVEAPTEGVRVGVRVEHLGGGRLRTALVMRAGGDVVVVPGGALWEELPARARAVLGDEEAWQRLQVRLSDAATHWPGMGHLMDPEAREEVELDREALGALAAAVLKLAAAGVEVYWPAERMSWLTSQVTIRHTPTQPVSSLHPAGGQHSPALDFSWQLVLGDEGEALTEEELDRLIDSQMPAVLLREKWVLIDDTVVARARAARRGRRAEDPDTGGTALETSGQALMEDPARLLAQVWQDAELTQRMTLPSLGRELYGYQEQGVRWMTRVGALGLGGILADEMGLGKTLQTIAAHVARQVLPATAGPMLVVCPLSVLHQWEAEIRTAAPGVPVRVLHGSRTDAAGLESNAVVLVTYQSLPARRAVLQGTRWGMVVADEAQMIKNSRSVWATAIRSVRAHARFALTGTPVSNNLNDLWALLDWTTPGLLGDLTTFRTTFDSTPGTRTGGAGGMPREGSLEQLIRPFLLRRTKADPRISVQLPPKTYTDWLVPMSTWQFSQYKALTKHHEEQKALGRAGGRMTLLTKLRKIANHPVHFTGEAARGDLAAQSGKLAQLDALISEIMDGDEAVLVFTQFVEMGKIIQRHLRDRGWDSFFLHGGIKEAQRKQWVEQFQAGTPGTPRIFLISTKAGGAGLHLTGANQVIHYDPWWNPAVMDQADGRAHRIGQTRHVQIHRLISKGTIEETIHQAITTKTALAQQILDAAAQSVDVLTDDNVLTGLLTGHLDTWPLTDPIGTPLSSGAVPRSEASQSHLPEQTTGQEQDEVQEESGNTIHGQPPAGPTRSSSQARAPRARHVKRPSASNIDAIINPKRLRTRASVDTDEAGQPTDVHTPSTDDPQLLEAHGANRDTGMPNDPRAFFRALIEDTSTTPETRTRPRPARNLRPRVQRNPLGAVPGSETASSTSSATGIRRAEQLLYGDGAGVVRMPLPLTEVARRMGDGPNGISPSELHEDLLDPVAGSPRYRADYQAARAIFNPPGASRVRRGKRDTSGVSQLIEEHAIAQGLRAETGRWWYEHLRSDNE